MLCANRVAVKVCEVLWHSSTVDQRVLKFGAVHRALNTNRTFVALPCVAPARGHRSSDMDGPLLMHWYSFSQSRVHFNRSEMKEASSAGQGVTQSKRSFEEKGEDTKRLRFDDDVPVPNMEEFSLPSHEWWQRIDVPSAASSHHQMVPMYGTNSVEALENAKVQMQSEESATETRKEILSKTVQQLRKWQHAGLAEGATDRRNEGMEFSLMSYNILAQDLLEGNFYLYGHCDPDVLSWDFRSKNLLEEIESARPDIVCLQELTQNHYEEVFRPRLSSLGWNSLYKKRTGGKQDGCAIFFRRSQFQLESYVSVEYFKPGIRLLDRDNVGLIAVLRPTLQSIGHRGSASKLCVANTHLLYNPRRGDIKLLQLQQLLAELDRIASGSSDSTCHPVVLCGDMNSTPSSPLYQFLTTGELVYDGLLSGNISGQKEGWNRGTVIRGSDLDLPQLGVSRDCRHESEENRASPYGCMRHGFNLSSAYNHKSRTGEVSVTTPTMTADYIFYSGGSSPLQLLGTLSLPTQREVAGLGGLPNAALSSDHLSLCAKFLLKF